MITAILRSVFARSRSAAVADQREHVRVAAGRIPASDARNASVSSTAAGPPVPMEL